MKTLRDLGREIRQESEEWFIVCCKCGEAASIASLGGVRYKAVSYGKRTLARCSNCKRIRLARFERRPGASPPAPDAGRV